MHNTKQSLQNGFQPLVVMATWASSKLLDFLERQEILVEIAKMLNFFFIDYQKKS